MLPFVALALGLVAHPQTGSSELKLEPLLRARPTTRKLLEQRAQYRLQVLVTQVHTAADGRVSITQSALAPDAEYTYPASAIKLLGAIAAVQRLEELQQAKLPITLDTPLSFEPLFDGDVAYRSDSSNADGAQVTLRHEVRKLFLVSDNPAYNRCVDYAGRAELHRMCTSAGLTSVRALHRLSVARTEAQNRQTPQILWRNDKGEWQSLLPARNDQGEYPPLRMNGWQVGTSWTRDNGDLVAQPMDFSTKNRVALSELQAALGMLVEPQLAKLLTTASSAGWALTDTHRAFLVATASSDHGTESGRYKFLLPGLLKHGARERWTYANKIGRAYGFSTENAWLADKQTGRTLLVTAVLYTNADGVLNDGKYEYAEIADPFFEELGDLLGEWLAR